MYYCKECGLGLPEDEGTPTMSPRFYNHVEWHRRRGTLTNPVHDGSLHDTAIMWLKKDELQYNRKTLY